MNKKEEKIVERCGLLKFYNNDNCYCMVTRVTVDVGNSNIIFGYKIVPFYASQQSIFRI